MSVRQVVGGVQTPNQHSGSLDELAVSTVLDHPTGGYSYLDSVGHHHCSYLQVGTKSLTMAKGVVSCVQSRLNRYLYNA